MHPCSVNRWLVSLTVHASQVHPKTKQGRTDPFARTAAKEKAAAEEEEFGPVRRREEVTGGRTDAAAQGEQPGGGPMMWEHLIEPNLYDQPEEAELGRDTNEVR